jgi:pyrroline-5-carboxylate reductase
MTPSVLLVGGGKMGGALLRGWLDRGLPADHATVIEPNEAVAAGLQGLNVAVARAVAELAPGFRPDIVVLAVKPQIMDEVVPPYAGYAGGATVFLSIAAGRTLASLAKHIGPEAAIVRAMPNTPAAVRRGITVACPNAAVTADQRAACHDLLEAVGEVAWIDDEALLDAVTATSGSGPAYVFLLIECLAEAGKEAGLPGELAARLARATVIGSGELARHDEATAATLRENVTSPGGTTEAALRVLMADDGLAPLMIRAVAAAVARSRELAG